MHQLLPHSLWIGHAGDGRDFRQLIATELQAVVQLAAEEPAAQPPRDLICCRFPLLDSTGNSEQLLLLAITTVANLLQMRVPTLVCCGAGMSRSPAIVAGALALTLRQTPETCLQQVARHHPHDVSPGLWNDVAHLLQSGRLVAAMTPGVGE